MSIKRFIPSAVKSFAKQRLNWLGYQIVPFTRPHLLASRGVSVLLDVGASEGLYAVEARRLGYTGRIVSFEPRAEAFARLEARSGPDPGWECVRLAFGAEAGTATIHLSGSGDSSSLLPMLPRVEALRPDLRYVGEETVEVQPLDAVFDRFVQPTDVPFLKLDVQGYERHVLDGAEASLSRIVGLQLELSMVSLYDGETLFHDMVKRLAAHGFELVAFEPGFQDPQTQQLLQADGIFLRAL